MMNRLEELWQSAGDGAFSPVSPPECRREAPAGDLLDAWYLERHNSIECEILLVQSKKLMGRLVSNGELSTPRRKQALRLLRAIDQALRMIHPDED